LSNDCDYGKSQQVRLLDIFVLGPLMVYVGTQAKEVSPVVKTAITLAGVSTVLYNLGNYTRIAALEEEG
jgi:hypothetical protein